MNALLKLAVIVAPTLGLLVWFGQKFPESEFSVHHKKAALFKAAKTKTKILILGTSHANEGIVPEIISPSAFNLAHPSQIPEYDAQLVAAADEKQLSLVVIAASPFSFAHKPLAHSAAKWSGYRYKSAYGFPNLDWRMDTEFRSYHPFFRHNRLFGLKDWLSGTSRLGTQLSPQGGLTNTDRSFGRLGQEEQVTQATRRVQQQQYSSALPKAVPKAWTQIVQHGTAKNTYTTYFLLMPYSTPYAAGMKEWMEAGKRLLLRDYPDNVIDLTQTPGLIDTHFHDPDHLNRAGAEIFTQELKKALASRLSAPLP